jgi:hypothetical protein
MMAMPMGTLMNITQRHDTHEVSAPPRIRPSEPPPADTAVKMPNALFRAGPSSKVALIRLSVLGAASAAPTPWTARVRSNMVEVVAMPPRSDAVVKIVSPMTSMRRRPKTSPARPPRSKSPPKARL